MTNPSDELDDKPLDPAILRVQARIRTMMMIAAVTLGVGLLAVVFAIVFRVSRLDRDASGAPFQSVIELRTKGTIASTSIDGDRVAFVIDGPEGRIVEMHDLRDGRLIGRTVLLSAH